MTEKKCNLFRYIASVLLIFHIIAIVISGNIGGGNLLTLLSDAVMIITLLTKKDKFFAIGIIICLIDTIVHILELIVTYEFDIGTIWYFLQAIDYAAAFLMKIVSIIPYVLIVISLFNVSKYKKLGLFSAILLFAIDILIEVFNFGFIGILSGLIVAIPSSLPIILGVIVIQNSPQNHSIVIGKKTSPAITTGEKLIKLKELLDMGAITQDEFDAKKKELLNL